MSGPLRQPPQSHLEVEQALRDVQSGRRTAVRTADDASEAAFRSDFSDRTLRVHGDIDMAAAEELHDAVLAMQRAYPAQDIELDLSDAQFVGACALDVIVAARHSQHVNGAELVLTGLTAQLKRTFDVCSVPT